MTASRISHVRVGTRASHLAVTQAMLVVSLLQDNCPNVEFEVIRISTAGDRDKRSPIESVGVSIFVKELEAALEDGIADIAVHSLKDMPSQLPAGFSLAALPKRGDPRDVLVSRFKGGLSELPVGARIGTSSPRRATQLRASRNDIEILPIRGNVDTRMAKALGGNKSGYDGAVLAAAGLDRMGRINEVTELLDPESFIPAAGQGTLAAETLSTAIGLRDLVASIDDSDTRSAASAERSFLARLGAGCATAAACYATLDGDEITVRGFAGRIDSDDCMTHITSGSARDSAEIGTNLAEEMIDQGALEFIRG